MSILVKDVMQKDVLTVSSELGIDALEQELCGYKVSGAPVVNNGKVVGVVSRADIFRHLCIISSRLAMAENDFVQDANDHSHNIQNNHLGNGVVHWMAHLKVSDIMSKPVLSVSSQTSLKEAGEIMLKEKIHRLVVMDQGELVGIISSMDFVKQSV